MEEQFREEELFLKELLKEAGPERPSANFRRNIMEAVQPKKETMVYKPLISGKGWFLVVTLLVSTSVVLYYMSAGWKYKVNFSFLHSVSIPKLNFSTVMLYGIGFISLFFLEIPFLKRLVEKQYQ